MGDTGTADAFRYLKIGHPYRMVGSLPEAIARSVTEIGKPVRQLFAVTHRSDI
jgi:hypothetical protein